MKKGDAVIWKNTPTENTPGRPDAYIACTGVIVTESLHDFQVDSMVDGHKWCEVLWSNNQVTRCYKDDLEVINLPQ